MAERVTAVLLIPLSVAGGALSLVCLVLYSIYYRWFHPLAGYPGPFLASVTNLWKVYQLSTLHLPETLERAHDKYGDVVRVGPNDLSFRTSSAYNVIYKGGRALPKTKFYDAFTAFRPNLFGTQDEDVRSSPSRRKRSS